MDDEDWVGETSYGRKFARGFGLENPRPILCQPQLGGVILEAGGKFYYTNMIGCDCSEILIPPTEGEIVELIRMVMWKELKLRKMY
ncbi:hypothetical protein BDW62DRAFT_127276 [Aspergillus aurantiobrunneus]